MHAPYLNTGLQRTTSVPRGVNKTNQNTRNEITGFCCGVGEVFAWDVVQRRFVVGYQSFRTAFRPHLQGSRRWNDMLFRNVGNQLPTSPRNILEQPRPRNTRTWMCLQTLRHSGLLHSVVWRKFWRDLLPHLQNARAAYLHGKYQSVQRHISKYRSLDIHDHEKPRSHACLLTWHFRLQTPDKLGYSTLTSVSPPPHNVRYRSRYSD
jgi:hypothetical protein